MFHGTNIEHGVCDLGRNGGSVAGSAALAKAVRSTRDAAENSGLFAMSNGPMPYVRGVRTTSEHERSPKAFTQRVNNLCLVVNDSAMTKELTIFKCLRRIWNPGGRGCASYACRRNMLKCPDECAARIAKILVYRRRLKLKEK